MTTIEAIRALSNLKEDAIIAQITVECPMCRQIFNVALPMHVLRYHEHFKAEWSTHKPDGFIAGQPFQIVRRV